MCKILAGVMLCAAMALSGPAAGTTSAVGQAIQKLRLTPQQLLSLRDVLGGIERGAQVEASGENLFVLRDPGSMAYAGEFSLTVAADGTMTVDRVSGPATLDASGRVPLPIRLNPKSRAQILAALTGSQILAPNPASPMAVPALPEERIAALKLTDAKAAGAVSQTRAIFFRDGSGVVWTVRVPQAATPGTAPAPTRVSERYYSAVKSDGTHTWRDNVVEVDSDVLLGLADLETHVCPSSGPCAARKPGAAAGAFHFIRWQHQLIAAVPPSLLRQLTPAPAPETASPVGTDVPSHTPAAPQGASPPAPAPAAPDNTPPENPADR